MPRGDGTGPKGRGMGAGRGFGAGKGFGTGRNMGPISVPDTVDVQTLDNQAEWLQQQADEMRARAQSMRQTKAPE